MALVWKCSCGQEWEEAGDGKAAGQAWYHDMARRREKDDSHEPIGLVDTETDEVLVEGFNARNAQARGYIAKNVESEYSKRKHKKTPGVGGSMPIRGKMPFVEIPIPPELWYLYILAMARFPGFDETPESFTAWLVNCVYNLYTMFPEVFGLDKFIQKAVHERGLVTSV